jgi:hypothetical protein
MIAGGIMGNYSLGGIDNFPRFGRSSDLLKGTTMPIRILGITVPHLPHPLVVRVAQPIGDG